MLNLKQLLNILNKFKRICKLAWRCCINQIKKDRELAKRRNIKLDKNQAYQGL
jgi:hypothetical protein